MYKSNAELIAAKDSVSLYTVREIALGLRKAQRISGDIARFVCTLFPLSTHERIQRIGAQYDTDDDIRCIFKDAQGEERPWRDMQPEDCEDMLGSADVRICIKTTPKMKFSIEFYPVFDEDYLWSATIEIGNVRVDLPNQYIKKIRYGPNIQLIHAIQVIQTGDRLAFVTNLEILRLAFLHEGIMTIGRPLDFFTDTKHLVLRVLSVINN